MKRAVRQHFSGRQSTSRMPTPHPLRILVVGAGVGGISIARGLLRDGHDVTVFEQRPDMRPGGGAVTIWSNGSTVLEQLGVDMDGAGQLLSTVRITTSTGRPLANIDLTAIVDRLGGPVRMVPRRVLLDRLLEGFSGRSHPMQLPCGRRGRYARRGADRVRGRQFGRRGSVDRCGWSALKGSRYRRCGRPAKPTGWCSWQGLITLPDITDKDVALQVIGEHGNLGLWPAGGSDLQWWFDLPWTPGLRQTGPSDRHDPVQFRRMVRLGGSGTRGVDRRRPGWFAVPTFSASDSSRAALWRGHVARRCRTHDAADPGTGHQSGTARHNGVAQGTFGFQEGIQRQQR